MSQAREIDELRQSVNRQQGTINGLRVLLGQCVQHIPNAHGEWAVLRNRVYRASMGDEGENDRGKLKFSGEASRELWEAVSRVKGADHDLIYDTLCDVQNSEQLKRGGGQESETMETHRVMNMDLPIIATLGDGWFLVAHPNGAAIASNHTLAALYVPPAEIGGDLGAVPEEYRAKAVEAFERLAWPLIHNKWYPDAAAEERALNTKGNDHA